MSEYDYFSNQQEMQQPKQYVQQPSEQQPMQQYVQAQMTNQPIFIAPGNIQVCSDLKKMLSSNMAFAAAILSVVPIFLLFLSGIIDNSFRESIVLSIPLMLIALEIWITFGTAKWSKSGTKIGGLVTGKVLSIINIVLTGFIIVLDLIGIIAWSIVSKLIGDYLDDLINEFFGVGGIYGNLAALGSGLLFVVFIISMIPLILNIMLMVQLNVFRNKLIDAVEGKLQKTPKTMFLVVLLFLVGLPLLGLAVILFIGGIYSGFAEVLIGIAYILSAAMYFYIGIFAAKCGRGH